MTQADKSINRAPPEADANPLKALIQEFRTRLVWRRRARKRMDAQEQYRGVEVGRHSYGKPNIHFTGSGARLKIGQFCSIADGVDIFLGGEHRIDWVTTYPFSAYFREAEHIRGHPATKGDVVIGNDVWIATGAMLLSGVTIGDGAVIGARSVVARDVEPYTIVSGNPARVVRLRFTVEQIEALLQIKWWDWPLEKIVENLPMLLSGDIDRFVEAQCRKTDP